MKDKMEDNFNTGETRYKDPSGKELTEQEYLKSLKKGRPEPPKIEEVMKNDN